MADPKLPPHNIQAEESVLGAMLIDRDAIVQIAEFLEPKHFYREAHRDIYDGMLKLFADREPIDVVTLTDMLKKTGRLKDIGGTAYLADLAAKVPTAAHVKQYAKIIKDMAIKRFLITLASDLSEMALNPARETSDILDTAEQNIFGLSQKHMDRSFISLKTALAESFDRLDELHKNSSGLRGVPTGFAELDDTLAGMQKSNLLILAARPGIGKTAFSLSIAKHVAVERKLNVGYFALEMSKEEMVDRLLVQQADIDAWKLKTGRLDEEDFEKLSDAMGELAEAPLFFDDTPGQSILEVRTKARRLMAEHGLDLIIVDYLQLMRGYTTDNRVQEVSEISQGLKNLARELKVPVLALSQLNRSVESRGVKQPQLSDLRESGCLLGDTLIFRSDTGKRVPIVSLVGKKNIPVLAMDETMIIHQAVMSKVFPSGKKMVYEMQLRSGKRITASANHPFFTVSGWKRLDQLKVGEQLGTPRLLEISKELQQTLTDDQLIVLAHLIGDGCYVKRQPLHYTNSELPLIQYVAESAVHAFGIIPRLVRQEQWYHLYLSSPYKLARGKRNPIVRWLDEDLGIYGQHSRVKHIPTAVFSQPNATIALFLRHLWSTDGCIAIRKEKKKGPLVSVYYASGSQRLAEDVAHLLLRLGVFSTVREVKQHGYQAMWNVAVQGAQAQRHFLEIVGCVGEKEGRARRALLLLQTVVSNPNLDVIPKALWKYIEASRAEFGLTTRAFHQTMGWAYSGTGRQRNSIGRERLWNIAEALDNDLLRMFASSDVYWDEILSITKIGIRKVFDATVPGYANFIANDIVVHNSIEQDSDVVMFLYREEDEAPEHVKLTVAKHRNGPLRTIDMFFKGDRIKFYGMEQKR
ncbi:MAG TPA: replicative DNA helicase [Candidatus Pacebacteria bacterium]|nr:MAG: Replicative DNA helicase [Microgenomates group bacterium GW2011_GWB1_45_17]KKU24156.1 MAG: Replicative DNA helicase [Microgenomates group bacterium GW2011_GWC1_46_15]KKU24871.1 MAG: Replicative DNA helicase [Microgenomates group bacterium GW2011_GWA1_46_15]HAV14755.1 replicative DNA helicase [Candidatus Paceibacterota bacterium]HCR11461.1 replicative DNA helicase [Candidatus Paceibacterota bacterium]